MPRNAIFWKKKREIKMQRNFLAAKFSCNKVFVENIMSMIFELPYSSKFHSICNLYLLYSSLSAIFQSAFSPFCCLFTSEEALSLHFYGRTANIFDMLLWGKAARKSLNPWLTLVLMKKRAESVDWLLVARKNNVTRIKIARGYTKLFFQQKKYNK